MKPKIVSLFSGAGGLDLGFKDAGFDVRFAVDMSPAAIATHKRNFPKAKALCANLVEMGADRTVDEIKLAVKPGSSIGVIGGPPCQGFSRANTGADPSDPRNLLPQLYLDIVAKLQQIYSVEFVLFENVLGITDRKHEGAFSGILDRLSRLGYVPRVKTYSALDFGVPQKRNRVIVMGFKSTAACTAFEPKLVTGADLTVRTAIEDLPEPTFFERHLTPQDVTFHPNHWTMKPKSLKFSTPGGERKNSRSFKRLVWDSPSPTVAYGHREIHVHPSGHRRLSILEAMTLQGFPRSFVLEGSLSAQVEQVSNAVPPPLALSLAKATERSLKVQRRAGE